MKVKLSLRNQVLIGFSAIFLTTVIFAAHSYFGVRKTKSETAFINQNIYPSLRQAISLHNEIHNLKRLSIDAIVEADEDFAEEAAEKGKECIAILIEIKIHDSHPLIDSLQKGLKSYISRTAELYRQADQGQIDLSGLPDTRPFFTALKDYKLAKEKALDDGLDRIRAQARSSFKLSIWFYALLSAILIVFFSIINSVTRSILDLKHSTQMITHGNLNQEIRKNRADEVGDLQQNFENMRATVKRTVENLDHLVKERTKEIADITDNVKIGLVTIDESMRVGNTFSRFAAHLLEADDIGGKSILEILYPQQPQKQKDVSDIIELMFAGTVPIESLNELLPDRYVYYVPPGDSREGKFLKLTFDAVDLKGNEKKKLMLSIEDMTKELALRAALKEKEKENSENLALVAILTEHGVDTFQNFVAKHWRELKGIGAILSETVGDKERLVELKRTFHTIKGDAGVFCLSQVSLVAHEIENTIQAATDGGGELDQNAIEEITAKTDLIAKEVQRLQGRIAHITGMGDQGEVRGANLDLSVMVPVPKVNHLLDLLKSKDHNELSPGLVEYVGNLKLVPCRKLFNRFPAMIKGLAERLKKKVNDVEMRGADALVDVELLEKLGDSLVHVMRNAVDHGIEYPEERLELGKDESGSIELAAEIVDNNLRISIRDDGRGIALEKLKEKALKTGILAAGEWESMSQEEKYRVILHPSLSVKSEEEITDVSGRGIGMNVVQTVVEEDLHGKIVIESIENTGTSFCLSIPLSPRAGIDQDHTGSGSNISLSKGVVA